MAQLPPAGWYPDPDGGAAPRWWDGRQWAPAPAPNSLQPAPRGDSRATRIVVAATVGGVVLFFALVGAATGGVGGFLSIVGLSGLVIGIVALVKGGIASLAIRNRALGGAVLAAGFVVMFTGGGIGAATSPRPASLVHTATESDAPRTTTSPAPSPSSITVVTEVAETHPIPFESVTVDDPNAATGTTVVTVAGVDGVLTVTYRVTTIDGVETSRVTVSEVVTTPPVSQVTAVGSRVDRQPVAAPPPPAAPAAPAAGGCDPNYSGCVPIASDVDCAGGSGNGPAYAEGPVNVIGSDIYGLDNDGDGVACE